LPLATRPPSRRSLRRKFATDGRRFYFTIADDDSDPVGDGTHREVMLHDPRVATRER
jgi:hypothetical protein